MSLLVSAYEIGHDSNICFFDIDKEEFRYIKYERLNNIKHYAANNHNELFYYLEEFGYTPKNIKEICYIKSPTIFPLQKPELPNATIYELGHHDAHLLSTESFSGLVYDGEGSEDDCLSIFKNHNKTISLTNKDFYSLGLCYNRIYTDLDLHREDVVFQSWQRANALVTDLAGKVMAWDAYGKYSKEWQDYYKHSSLKDFDKLGSVLNFLKNKEKWISTENHFEALSFFVANLTYKGIEEVLKLLRFNFNKDEAFTFSGGVAQNLIMNNKIKQEFSNFNVLPHMSDDGLSIGGMIYLLQKNKIDFSIIKQKNFPFIQSDQDMGYAKNKTIKKVAEILAKGEIVLWCQGNGEIGPRALGHRSILMNPAIPDAKEQVNAKVKNREWYRPYAASVKVDKYREYFDLPWESPYMLYQAQVKDQDKFKSITHADGTCRIQTVNPSQETFYQLLDEFEKLTGFPIILNTSMNKPGNPIVGTKQRATEMFETSQVNYLVIGDELYSKENNND